MGVKSEKKKVNSLLVGKRSSGLVQVVKGWRMLWEVLVSSLNEDKKRKRGGVMLE